MGVLYVIFIDIYALVIRMLHAIIRYGRYKKGAGMGYYAHPRPTYVGLAIDYVE